MKPFHIYLCKMQIIGHRGAAGLAPENTLLAIQKALDAGADWIEFDVHLTRDGHLVVIHDPNILRVSGHYATIKRSDLESIRQIPLRAGQIVPTFAEVVQLIGNRARINVEVKSR